MTSARTEFFTSGQRPHKFDCRNLNTSLVTIVHSTNRLLESIKQHIMSNLKPTVRSSPGESINFVDVEKIFKKFVLVCFAF